MKAAGALDPTAAARGVDLEHLFAIASLGVYSGWLDSRLRDTAGTPILVNAGLRHLLGYAADVSDAAVRLLDPAHYVDASARDRLIDTILSAAGAHDDLIQLRRRDGTVIWAEVTAGTVGTPGGLLRIDAIVRDVTQRRQREEQARQLYQQLAHSEQLAAIGRTLADVAHELRNPLAAIVGWAERLGQQTLDEKSARGVSEILAASERAARIVRNMVQTASRQASTRALVDVNDVIAETLLLRLHDQRAMNIVAKLDFTEGLPPVFADAHQVQQILLNIIINAEQAMSAANGRGELIVRTTADERRHMAIVEVSDDGPGVPEAVRSRVFDPFFTTKPPGTGTGLGLAVAQALAHEHGGSIRLAHEQRQGSTFVIELPTRDLAAVIT